MFTQVCEFQNLHEVGDLKVLDNSENACYVEKSFWMSSDLSQSCRSDRMSLDSDQENMKDDEGRVGFEKCRSLEYDRNM